MTQILGRPPLGRTVFCGLLCDRGQIFALHQEEETLTVPKLGDVSLVLSFLILPCGLCLILSWAMTEGYVLSSVAVVEEVT